MIAHENRLNARSMTRTVLATSPLDSIRPEISPPIAEARNLLEKIIDTYLPRFLLLPL
jgi:hypothetical protein